MAPSLLAAKENSSLPVLCTMTFEGGGRTFTGCSVAAMALTPQQLYPQPRQFRHGGGELLRADVVPVGPRLRQPGVGLHHQGQGGVALDIGPLGQLLEPTGTLSFQDAYDAFALQVRAGAEAGAGLIAIGGRYPAPPGRPPRLPFWPEPPRPR